MYFKNSLTIHEEITPMSVVLYVIKIMFIYINFSFDFLGFTTFIFKSTSPMNSSDGSFL